MIEVNEDYSLYWGNTVVYDNHKKQHVVLDYTDDDEILCYNYAGDRYFVDPEDLEPVRARLGFVEFNGDLYFLNRVPNRSAKRSLHGSNVHSFLPQRKELRTMRKSYHDPFSSTMLAKVLDTPEKKGTLRDMEKGKFVIVDRYYAFVAKGYTRNPVLYYKDMPVGEVTEGKLEAYEGLQFICEKFEMEYGYAINS